MSAYSDLILSHPLLVLYMKCDDTGSVWKDSGPGSHDGFFHNTPVKGEPRLADGTSIRFKGGTNNADDGDTAEIDAGAGSISGIQANGAMTIEFWMKTTMSGLPPYMVASDSVSSAGRFFITLLNGNKAYFAIFDTGASGYNLTGTTIINDGVKHHIACTYDGTTMKIYVDGHLDASSVLGVPLANQNHIFTAGFRYISSSSVHGADYFIGTLDEIALYTGALSQATIQTHVDAGNVVPFPALIPSDPGDPGLAGSLAQLRMQLEDGRDLTPLWETANFTTLAVGGFGSLEFALEGWRARDEVPKLTLVRVTYGPELLWEGRIEDVAYHLSGGSPGSPGDLQTIVSCYGLSRLLNDDTERQIWSMRAINWKLNQAANGYVMGLETKTKDLDVQTGAFDPTDLTKGGVQIQGGGVSIATTRGNGAEIILPQGMTAKRIRGIVTLVGANTGVGKLVGLVEWSDAISGSYIWVSSIYRAAGPTAVDEDLSTPSNTIIVRLSAYNEGGGALTPTAADLVAFYNLRILCTSLNEDTVLSTANGSGGFYGGTLMRQIVNLVAGLKQGTIEDATEFVIDQLERQVRGTATSLIEEIAQYSARQWAVWEDGTFDWKSINFDEPQWIVPVEACSSIDITSSVDGQAKRVVVLYTDPATGLTAEQSSSSTDGRNPFVKYAAARDYLLDNGAMTANTAAQLAAKINTNQVGAYTPASGQIVIPALTIIPSAHGGHGLPACCIRAGCNVTIPGLPKTDPFDTGRDGETLFHVVRSEVDLGEGTVTLELENSTRRTEALLARLAAVTQRLTRF